MSVTKKQIPNEGESKNFPSPIFVKATVKMIYGGKTIFPGNTMACTQQLANALFKAGMAEPGPGNGSRIDNSFLEPEPSAPLTTALEPPRNAMMPRAKFRRKGGRK